MLLESSDDELSLHRNALYANLASGFRSSSRSADPSSSSYFQVTPSRRSLRSAMSGVAGSSSAKYTNSPLYSTSYATLRRSLPTSSVSPGYLAPLVMAPSNHSSHPSPGRLYPQVRSQRTRERLSSSSHQHSPYNHSIEIHPSAGHYQNSLRTPINHSSSSTCSSDSTTSQILISSGTPSPPRGYLNLPPPPPPSKPPPLPPPNLPPRPINGFAKSCHSIPSSLSQNPTSSDKYYYQGVANVVGSSSKSQSNLVLPTHQVEPTYSNKHYMSTHSLGASLGTGIVGRIVPMASASSTSIPSMNQPLAPRNDQDDDEVADKVSSHASGRNYPDNDYSKSQRDHYNRSRHPRHRSRSTDSNEVSCFLKYMLFACNMIAWIMGFLIMAAGVWAWNEKDYLSNLFNIPLLTLDPAFGLIVLGGLTFMIGFVGCVGALRENTCLLASYSIFLVTLLVLELSLSVLAFVMKDWIKSQATQGMQAFIVYYRDDPDRQNLIDWIQESWLECCGIDGPKDWDMNIYFNCSSVAQGSKEACGVPFSCCRSDSANIYDDSVILKNKQCGYDVRKPDFMRDRSSIISEKGCLRAAEEWIEGNFVLISFLTLAVAAVQKLPIRSAIMTRGCLEAGEEWFLKNLLSLVFVYLIITFVEILSICFSQNLRADIIAQKSK